MAGPIKGDQAIADLLRDLVAVSRDSLIAQLSLAGLTQHQIREIVGVDIHRVNRIAKHLKKAKGELT